MGVEEATFLTQVETGQRHYEVGQVVVLAASLDNRRRHCSRNHDENKPADSENS